MMPMIRVCTGLAVGDVAWLVFDWEFNAIQTDGKPMQSRLGNLRVPKDGSRVADSPRALLCPGGAATNWRKTRAIDRAAVSLMRPSGLHRRA